MATAAFADPGILAKAAIGNLGLAKWTGGLREIGRYGLLTAEARNVA